MSRRHLTFSCAGATLAATLDEAPGTTGLLLVTGGNEVRAGAFSGQARLAARVAAAGHPVFRFDRRGVGDSSGQNAGFTASAPDIAAALAAFRAACPALRRVVGHGNCDAASALMLGGGDGLAALVLANPWTFDTAEDDTAAPLPAAAIRARYAERLLRPSEWWRLLSGGVNLAKLAHGLAAALRPALPPTTLLGEMQAGCARFAGPVQFLIAGRDRTGQAFAAAWPKHDPRLATREGADHAFSDPGDSDWLYNSIIAALEEQAGQLDMG